MKKQINPGDIVDWAFALSISAAAVGTTIYCLWRMFT